MSVECTKKCPVCGILFTVPNQRRKSAKYCSRQCYIDARRAARREVCCECGRVFERAKPDQKYCSRKCAAGGRSRRRRRDGALPPRRWCSSCSTAYPVDRFIDEHGRMCAECADCRRNRGNAAARLHTCRDCGTLTSNRMYCPSCLHAREYGGSDDMIAA